MPKPVILLFGGESRERMVSVATAQNLAQALGNATCWFWSPDNAVYVVDKSVLCAHQNPFTSEFVPSTPANWTSLEKALDSSDARESIIFVGIHGGRGEDGTVQRWMEQRGLKFTGSGSRACHLAFDKVAGKKVVEAFGVRVPHAITVDGHDIAQTEKQLRAFLASEHKIVLKPVADGSSVGLFIVDSAEQLAPALKHLTQSPNTLYLAETFIKGTELTIGVFDDVEGPHALPCIEIRVHQGHAFDYNGKYLGQGSEEICPAEVPDNIARMAQRVALAAHSAFGCDGYSRTDLIVDDKGPVFLELNTLPGMTKASLVPQQLAVEGISLKTFCNRQLELAQNK